MKEKFSQIRSPLNRLYITSVILFFYCREKLITPRARVHWIGGQRPRRFERHLTALLFLSAMLLLEPYEYAAWAAIQGSITSIFLVLYTMYLLIPRKRVHWI